MTANENAFPGRSRPVAWSRRVASLLTPSTAASTLKQILYERRMSGLALVAFALAAVLGSARHVRKHLRSTHPTIRNRQQPGHGKS